MTNPLPLFINSIMQKNYSALSPIRYSAITLMQLLWTLYGIQISNDNVIKASFASGSMFCIFAISGFIL